MDFKKLPYDVIGFGALVAGVFSYLGYNLIPEKPILDHSKDIQFVLEHGQRDLDFVKRGNECRLLIEPEYILGGNSDFIPSPIAYVDNGCDGRADYALRLDEKLSEEDFISGVELTSDLVSVMNQKRMNYEVEDTPVENYSTDLTDALRLIDGFSDLGNKNHKLRELLGQVNGGGDNWNLGILQYVEADFKVGFDSDSRSGSYDFKMRFNPDRGRGDENFGINVIEAGGRVEVYKPNK